MRNYLQTGLNKEKEDEQQNRKGIENWESKTRKTGNGEGRGILGKGERGGETDGEKENHDKG